MGCEKESVQSNSLETISKINIKKVSLKDFDDKVKVENYLKSIKPNASESNQSRFLYDSINNFTVYTDEFVVMENGDRQWLIFSVFRDYETDVTENLVLMNINAGEYIPNLYRYNLTDEELYAFNNGGYVDDLNSKLEIVPLNGYNNFVYNRNGGYSYTIYPLPDGRCGVITHIDRSQEFTTGIIYVSFITVECPGGGAGNSNDPPSSNYSSSDWNGIFNNYLNNNHYYDAYGNGGNSNYINSPEGGFINLPNDPNDYYLDITYLLTPPQVDENILALNDITNNTRKPYKQKIAELKAGLDDSLESGYEFKTNTDNTIQPIQVPSTALDGIQFPIPSINSIVRMHNHPNGIDPIFSKKDVIGMSELFAVKDDFGATDAENVTSLLVTPRGLYALRVNDPDKAIVFNQDMKNGLEADGTKKITNFFKTYKDWVITTPSLLCGGCNEEDYFNLIDEYFVTWLNEWNTGLTLYKGTENEDGTYSWTLVED